MPSVTMAQNNFSLSDDFDKVKKIAASNDNWMYLFPDDDLQSFGFNNTNELKQAKAGNPIEVFHMYRDYDGNPGVVKPGEFMVPIIYNNEVRAFVTIAFFEGKYQVVSGGEMGLAKDVSTLIMKQREANAKLVWLKQLNYQADFIAESTNMIFQPLFTAKRAMVFDAASYTALQDYFQTLPLSSN